MGLPCDPNASLASSRFNERKIAWQAQRESKKEACVGLAIEATWPLRGVLAMLGLVELSQLAPQCYD